MRISRVVPHLDHQRLAKRYQVFRLHSSKGRFGYADEVFDRLAASSCVASVVFQGESAAWVMMAREDPGTPGAKVVRECIAGRDDLAFREVRPLNAVEDRTLLQLCLAAVAGSGGVDGASNICGRLIVASLGKPHTQYFRGTSVPSCIHALEVRVSPRMELELKVRTFTSCARRRFKIEKPRFELIDGRYLRRALSYTDQNAKALYCQGTRYEGDRYGGFAFMDASSADKFSKSKLGILRSVLVCLDDLFEDALRIEFEEAEDISRIDRKGSKRDERMLPVTDRLKDRPVCVCDMTGILGKQALTVATTASEALGTHVDIVGSPDSGALNLLLVKAKEDYDSEDEDPYGDVKEGVVVQHMTPSSGFTETATLVALKELAMKLDVVDGRMSLFEWRWGSWCFCLRILGKEEDTFSFLDVAPDGSMSCEGPMGMIDMSAEHQALACALMLNKDCEFAVRGPAGDVNAIGRTELYGIPNYETIWHDLVARREDRETRSGGRPMKCAIGRGKNDRRLYFADAIDIASCRTSDGRLYYRVGLRGYGMQFSATHKASILREVIPHDGSRPLVDELLHMMDVDLIRWGQPTVVPFPIKYLREWLALRGVS